MVFAFDSGWRFCLHEVPGTQTPKRYIFDLGNPSFGFKYPNDGRYALCLRARSEYASRAHCSLCAQSGKINSNIEQAGGYHYGKLGFCRPDEGCDFLVRCTYRRPWEPEGAGIEVNAEILEAAIAVCRRRQVSAE